jgi:hypothetical protein
MDDLVRSRYVESGVVLTVSGGLARVRGAKVPRVRASGTSISTPIHRSGRDRPPPAQPDRDGADDIGLLGVVTGTNRRSRSASRAAMVAV